MAVAAAEEEVAPMGMVGTMAEGAASLAKAKPAVVVKVEVAKEAAAQAVVAWAVEVMAAVVTVVAERVADTLGLD